MSRFAFGLLFDGRLGGTVVYGEEYGENLGVWDQYGFTGRIIALLRGACLPWAHLRAGSVLVRRSIALLPHKFKVLIGPEQQVSIATRPRRTFRAVAPITSQMKRDPTSPDIFRERF